MNAAVNAAAPTAGAPPAQDSPDAFASKTEADSAAEYFRSARPTHAASCRRNAHFRYYSQLWAQQNMLQDIVRTGVYHSAGKRRVAAAAAAVTRCAVSMNASDFRGKSVLDVGAGSGMCVPLVVFAALLC